MKKKILISLLIVSFFNYIGCYSYYSLTEEEINAGRPYPDDEIRLVLKDSTEVDFGPTVTHFDNDGFYLNLDKPDSLLIGSGSIFNPSTKIKKNYQDIVELEMIDSSKIFYVDSKLFSVYWLKDHNRLSFEEKYFAEILPGQGAGYYILEPPDPMKQISFNEVKEIQAESIDWLKTGLLLSAFIALSVLTGLLLGDFHGMSDLPSFSWNYNY